MAKKLVRLISDLPHCSRSRGLKRSAADGEFLFQSHRLRDLRAELAREYSSWDHRYLKLLVLFTSRSGGVQHAKSSESACQEEEALADELLRNESAGTK